MRIFLHRLLLPACVSLLAACGGSGGGSDGGSGLDSGAPPAPVVTQGKAVDPYIVGAVFQEVTPAGVVLQRESTPSDAQGNFSFPGGITAGSIIEMKVGSRGTHNGTPFAGILRRQVEVGADGTLVVSPLTTLIANGAAPEAVLSFLAEAGLTGMSAADLTADPMAGLDNLRPAEVTDSHLRNLRAAMAVNTFLDLVNNYGAGAAELSQPANRLLMRDVAQAARVALDVARFQQLAVAMSGDPQMAGQPMLAGDAIRLAADCMQNVADLAGAGTLPSSTSMMQSVQETIGMAEETVRGYILDRTAGPPVTPAPDPTPAPAVGQTVYDSRCAGCHVLGSYDASGFAPNLAGKDGMIPAKLQAGHMGVSFPAADITAVTSFVAAISAPPAPTPAPDTPSTPAPLDGAALYASECQGCHGALATTSVQASTAAAIEAAISSNLGGMGRIILTSEQIVAIAAALPAAAPAPAPSPAPPAPANGQAVYDGRCAGCHVLGTYDASGFAPNLAGKDGMIAAKLQAGHQGISLTAADITALGSFVAANSPAPAPDPTPVPAPVDGNTVYDVTCSVCHLLGTYDTSGFAPDLAGKGGLVGAKTAGGHGGGPYAADTLASLVSFIAAATPVTSPSPAPPSYTDCTACHGQPPAGSTFPNTAGAHAAHRALPGIGTNCAICHQGASHNGWIDLAFQSGFNAKAGTAVDNGDGTCSNLSCHGGQQTPAWWTGSIDVNTQCTSCHAAGTTQFNGYSSGEHSFHTRRYACTVCHEVGKLATNHFTSLGTPAMEGPAGATIGGGTTRVNSYNQTTRSCSPSCHGSETW